MSDSNPPERQRSHELMSEWNHRWVLPAGSSRRRSSTGPGMVSAPSAAPRKTPRADTAALPEVAEETTATSAAPATTKSAGGGRKASTSRAGKAKAEAAATPVVVEVAASKGEAPSGSEPASNRSAKSKGEAKARPSTGSVEIAETPPPPPPTRESGSPSKPRPPTAASIKQDKQLQVDWERRFNELGATVAITDDSQLEDGTVFYNFAKTPVFILNLANAETCSWHTNRYARLGALRSASLLSGRSAGSACRRHAVVGESGSAPSWRSQQSRCHVL